MTPEEASLDLGERRGFSEREIKLAAPAVNALRECRSKDEAITVLALICKTVIEIEPRRRLYEWAK